jgi:L-aminopeptidase/D-esterase-like protein
VLAGGSAFGLAAADGVVKYLEEKHVGFSTAAGVVPIVPAAILYDLQVGKGSIRPGPDCGYAAARAATSDPVVEGNVGAGAGATVGKLMRADRAMKGGVGSAAIEVPGGLVVAAIVAVNAAGNVMDPTTGQFIAGGRTMTAAALRIYARCCAVAQLVEADHIENTTIGVVAHQCDADQGAGDEAAQMAHDGYARVRSIRRT